MFGERPLHPVAGFFGGFDGTLDVFELLFQGIRSAAGQLGAGCIVGLKESLWARVFRESIDEAVLHSVGGRERICAQVGGHAGAEASGADVVGPGVPKVQWTRRACGRR